MHPGINPKSNTDNAVDDDPLVSNIAWDKCSSSTAFQLRTVSDMAVQVVWLAIDLKGVFLISRVRAAFRLETAENTAVFVGNHPSRIDGSDDYKCGDRLGTSAEPSPVFHNFTCQPVWASHVSIQRTPARIEFFFLQVCEVEVYYSSYTSAGMLLFLHLPQNHIRHCSAPCLLCFTQELTFPSIRRPLLHKRLLWVNRCCVRQR